MAEGTIVGLAHLDRSLQSYKEAMSFLMTSIGVDPELDNEELWAAAHARYWAKRDARRVP